MLSLTFLVGLVWITNTVSD